MLTLLPGLVARIASAIGPSTSRLARSIASAITGGGVAYVVDSCKTDGMISSTCCQSLPHNLGPELIKLVAVLMSIVPQQLVELPVPCLGVLEQCAILGRWS